MALSAVGSETVQGSAAASPVRMCETGSLVKHEDFNNSQAKELLVSRSAISEGPSVASARDCLDHSLQVPRLDGNSRALSTQPLSPEEPQFITVQERKLQVEATEDKAPSIYTLCRRWVQNNPEADDDSFAEPSATTTAQPPELPAAPAAATERSGPPECSEADVPPPPCFPASSLSDGAPLEELRKELRFRALAVRSHFKARRQAKARACALRIARLLEADGLKIPRQAAVEHQEQQQMQMHEGAQGLSPVPSSL